MRGYVRFGTAVEYLEKLRDLINRGRGIVYFGAQRIDETSTESCQNKTCKGTRMITLTDLLG